MTAPSANHRITTERVYDDIDTARLLFGDLNRNLLALEKATGVAIHVRGSSLTIAGMAHDTALASSMLDQLYTLVGKGYPVYPQDIVYGLKVLERSPRARLADIFLDKVLVTASKRVVSPKSQNQKIYIDAIRNHDIVFGIGPAGTGKTYLAVAMAVAAMAANEVKSIILTRPAVEAGERLGFLPGDISQKVDPYLRPLLDALHDMLGRQRTMELQEQGILEIAPLAFMRGRTLNNAFVILDEAQNTTSEQMKMFLTRLGFQSKAIITGDITQIDLPVGKHSGLKDAKRLLKKIDGISFCSFSHVDVVRHPLVQSIIKAYEKKGKKGPAK